MKVKLLTETSFSLHPEERGCDSPRGHFQHLNSVPAVTHPDDGKQQKALAEENLTNAARKVQLTTSSSHAKIFFFPCSIANRGPTQTEMLM